VNAISHTTSVVFSPAELAVIPFADSICFDASVYRIFSPLSCGGSIVILDSILSLPDSRWAPFVTALGSAPSVLNDLVHDFRSPNRSGSSASARRLPAKISSRSWPRIGKSTAS
jgi:non-ribosomal peptide synthetase component F